MKHLPSKRINMFGLIIPGLVMVLFCYFPTTAISFAAVEKDNSNAGDNSSVLNNSFTSSTKPENQTLELESILGHLERARNAIGADAAEAALAEIDKVEKTLTGSIRDSINIISNITDPN